jgi:quercetin dioxygenase-like cupin family protein
MARVGGLGDLRTASRVFRFGELPVTRGANGGESRNILAGLLVTGEAVAMHESMQPAGVKPNPAHRIEHTELICLREGTLEFEHDGKTERAEAGDIIFVAKGTLHAARNVGAGPAAYFVVAIGGDVDK